MKGLCEAEGTRCGFVSHFLVELKDSMDVHMFFFALLMPRFATNQKGNHRASQLAMCSFCDRNSSAILVVAALVDRFGGSLLSVCGPAALSRIPLVVRAHWRASACLCRWCA